MSWPVENDNLAMTTLIATKNVNSSYESEQLQYGTFEDFGETSINTPLLSHETHVYVVDVEQTEICIEEVHDDVTDDPVPTPNVNSTPRRNTFKNSTWWLKGGNEEWYPYDNPLNELHQFENKMERIFGHWVNITSPNQKSVANRWNNGDATISYHEFGKDVAVPQGPADRHWKMSLWMRAQPFQITCYDNPLLEGDGIKCTESWINNLLNEETNDSEIEIAVPKPKRFLVLETVHSFSPKVVYEKEQLYEVIHFD